MVIGLFENCLVSSCFLLNLVHRRYKVMFDVDLVGRFFSSHEIDEKIGRLALTKRPFLHSRK